MKHACTLFFVLFATSLFAQHTVTVTNGYGSGTYNTGDTVHIWSTAYDSTQTFDAWTGDVSLLESAREWHSWLVMPGYDVNFTAHTRSMPPYQIQYEQIMGVNNLKNVYYYFPPNYKGVVYLFHGTGGSASGWIYRTENRSFTNAAIADTFAIIVTEAEEITLNTDLNGDGKLRWQSTPFDSTTNIDYGNLKAITDTFVNRGLMTYGTKRFALGMSNGGSFSTTETYLFHYHAGISYCASGPDIVFNYTNVPFAFRMALYDDNDEVGPAGNYQAWQHDSILEARGICHQYKIHDHQPLYPERFARIPGVSISVSQGMYNELVTNGQLNAQHYALPSDTIFAHIMANPFAYPLVLSQSSLVLEELGNEIQAANAQHHFYSDWNAASLDFFDHLCSQVVAAVQEEAVPGIFMVYPNPAQTYVQVTGIDLQNDFRLVLYDYLGHCLRTVYNQSQLNVEDLAPGMYLVQVWQNNNFYTARILKV